MDRRPGGGCGLPRRVYERVGATAATHFPKAPDPRILICTRIIHISGHIGSLWSLFSGEVVVLMDGFDGRDYVIPDDVQVSLHRCSRTGCFRRLRPTRCWPIC